MAVDGEIYRCFQTYIHQFSNNMHIPSHSTIKEKWTIMASDQLSRKQKKLEIAYLESWRKRWYNNEIP